MLPPFGSPDRLLTRFRRTGDPRALGRLFDLSAPELLRAALWLAGNRADAEDLLQRTFLTVIEARSNYDPSRRAMPWLLGVLGNHARKLHARREREHGRTPWLELEPSTEPDPQTHAVQGELRDLITRLRGELGAPYTEVLDLHLGQGLAAGEIAVQLGRPAGTVRTQLVRGLDLLRRRIPPGLLAPMLAFTALAAGAEAQGLAAIRRTIVRAAAAAAPTAAVATSLAKPLALGLAALLVTATTGVSWWFARNGSTDSDRTAPTPAAIRDDVTEGDARPGPGVRTDGGTTAAAAAAPTALAPDQGRAHGLVVDTDGAPVPHAALWLSWPDDRGAYAAAGTADADGRFAIVFTGRALLGASSPGMVASFVHTVLPARDQQVELRLRGPSGTACGFVYDHRGAPLAGARVQVGLEAGFRVRNATRVEAFYPPRRTATTDAAGAFSLDVEPGAADVLVRAVGHGPYRGSVEITAGRTNPIAVQLQAGATVHGTVRTGEGPAPAAAQVGTLGTDGVLVDVAPNGTFELRDLPAGTVQVFARSADATLGEVVHLAPGERRRMDFVLQQPPAVNGNVLDERGAPVAGVRLVAGSLATGRSELGTTGQDGSFSFPDTPSVHAGDGILLLHGDVPLARLHPHIAPGEHLRLVLTDAQLPTAGLHGRIHDADGRPLHVLLRVSHHAFLEPFYGASADDGRFDLGRLPPGDYTIVAETRGHGRVPRRVLALQAREHRDLGTWLLTAALPVELELRGSGAGSRRLVQFARDDGLVVSHAMSEGDRVQAELPPGHYTAAIAGGAEDGSALRLDVQGTAPIRGVLPCAPTARAAVTITGFTDVPTGRRVELVLRDPDGRFLDARELVPPTGDTMQTTIGLPPGSYAIECRTTDGLTATADVVIHAADERPHLRFALR